MTTSDKCKILSMANKVGGDFFNNDQITNAERAAALRAIRELIDLLMLEPEDNMAADPLTGEKRWP